LVASCASNALLFVIATGIGEGSRNAPRLKALIPEGEPRRARQGSRGRTHTLGGQAMGQIFWNEYYRLLDSGENVDVLAIGDSWFHYPANNLITPIHRVLKRPTIYVIGENGARADELARGSWLANFQKMLSQYPSIRLVSISAGGNDFAGIGDLDDRIFAPDCSGATSAGACFRAGQPDGVFDAVTIAYRVLIAAVVAVRTDVAILVHNYDYAIPDGRTLPGVRIWLKLPMARRRSVRRH
jgi:hypothetical protein